MRFPNPMTLTLRAGRGALRRLFAVLRWKLILSVGLAASCVLVLLAGIYVVTAPLSVARGFATFLRGGAADIPAHVVECIPDSGAVHAGRYTAPAERIVSEIPQDATIAPATAFLLYRWSHIGDQGQWQPTWNEWQSHLNARMIRATASDIDIAQSVDPEMDYRPYLVPARATTIGLSISGSVVAGKRQIEDVAQQIYQECKRRDEQRRSASGPDPHARTYTDNRLHPTSSPRPTQRLDQPSREHP